MPKPIRPSDGQFGIAWSRIPEICLQPFASPEQRACNRLQAAELACFDLVLKSPRGLRLPVLALDASARGFRLQPKRQAPLPLPGEVWELSFVSPRSAKLQLNVAVVWAQKRPLEVWEAGFACLDLGDSDALFTTFPTPCHDLERQGMALPGYLGHSLLPEEPMPCEILRLAGHSQFLLRIRDEAGACFPGDVTDLHIALPNLETRPMRVSVKAVAWQEKSLLAQVHTLSRDSEFHRLLGQYLRKLAGGGAKTAQISKTSPIFAFGGFENAEEETPVDIQGLSLGPDSRRRVIGAFVESKLVATLAYCLDAPDSGLRIEGLSLQSRAARRNDIPQRLFGVAARALLLAAKPALIAQIDEEHEAFFRAAGFRECKTRTDSGRHFVLRPNDILWGWQMPFPTWWRYYRPMIADLLRKKLIVTSPWHRLWVGLFAWTPKSCSP